MSPARYFPIESGRYEVKPGLFKFGTDFGNGDADRQVFQIDDEFSEVPGTSDFAGPAFKCHPGMPDCDG